MKKVSFDRPLNVYPISDDIYRRSQDLSHSCIEIEKRKVCDAVEQSLQEKQEKETQYTYCSFSSFPDRYFVFSHSETLFYEWNTEQKEWTEVSDHSVIREIMKQPSVIFFIPEEEGIDPYKL